MKETTRLTKEIRKLRSEMNKLIKQKKLLQTQERNEKIKKERPFKIDLIHEAKYVAKLLFKDYNVIIVRGNKRTIRIKVGTAFARDDYEFQSTIYKTSDLSKKTNLMKVRTTLGMCIRNSIINKSGGCSVLQPEIERTIKEDFDNNTKKDPKYEMIVQSMLLEEL
jgi:hypothetical protein